MIRRQQVGPALFYFLEVPTMSDLATPDSRLSPNSRAAKKPAQTNSGAWILMALAFLIALVVYFYMTGQSQKRFEVAVVTRDLAVGSKISETDLRSVSVNLPREQLDRLVLFDAVSSIQGSVIVAPVTAGDPLVRSSVRPSSTSNGLRAMSVPVDKERAVAGSLVVGDRVDIVDTTQGFADNLAARNLEVLGVQAPTGGALGGSSNFSITVAVTSEDAVNIAKSVNNNKFLIVRSTGATPLSGSAAPASTPSSSAPAKK